MDLENLNETDLKVSVCCRTFRFLCHVLSSWLSVVELSLLVAVEGGARWCDHSERQRLRRLGRVLLRSFRCCCVYVGRPCPDVGVSRADVSAGNLPACDGEGVPRLLTISMSRLCRFPSRVHANVVYLPFMPIYQFRYTSFTKKARLILCLCICVCVVAVYMLSSLGGVV